MKRFARGLFWFVGMLFMYGAWKLSVVFFTGPMVTTWPFNSRYTYALLFIICIFLGVVAFTIGERRFKTRPPTG